MHGQTSGVDDGDGKWSFLWLSVQNILPVSNALARQRLPIDPICCTCLWYGTRKAETTSHMLLHCERAVKVWILSPLRFRPEVLVDTEIGHMWTEIGVLKQYEGEKWKIDAWPFCGGLLEYLESAQ